jgi:hypothetical protein
MQAKGCNMHACICCWGWILINRCNAHEYPFRRLAATTPLHSPPSGLHRVGLRCITSLASGAMWHLELQAWVSSGQQHIAGASLAVHLCCVICFFK